MPLKPSLPSLYPSQFWIFLSLYISLTHSKGTHYSFALTLHSTYLHPPRTSFYLKTPSIIDLEHEILKLQVFFFIKNRSQGMNTQPYFMILRLMLQNIFHFFSFSDSMLFQWLESFILSYFL